MGSLGVPEMILIFILALVLFGPKKLPEIGRQLGKAITEFRRASAELKTTFEREMQTLEQETQPIKQELTSTQYHYDGYNYDYSSYEPQQEVAAGETSDSIAASPSTESASAPQGAESPSAGIPEGTVAYGSEPVAEYGTEQASEQPLVHEQAASSSSTATPAEQHKA